MYCQKILTCLTSSNYLLLGDCQTQSDANKVAHTVMAENETENKFYLSPIGAY